MFNTDKVFTAKNIIFAIMTILVLIFIGKISDIALMLFAAFVVTSAMNPIVNKLQKFMPRVLAVSLLLLVILLGVLLIFIPLIVFTVKQSIHVLNNFPNYLDDINYILNFKIFSFSLSNFLNINSLKDYGADITSSILSQSFTAGKIAAGSLTTSLAVAIMVFYLSYDQEYMRESFIAFFPPKFKEKAGRILDTITTKVGGYVFAQVLAMILVGVLTAIGLLIIGNRHWLILGFITSILDIVPVIGPTIAVAAGLATSVSGGFLYVILTFVVFMVAQWIQNQLLRPVIFAKLMDMHPLLIIISLLIGAKFMGFWGVILAPAIASVVCVLVEELYLNPINKGK